MSLDLTKIYQPGTWRYLGVRAKGRSVGDIPIAAKSISSILQRVKGRVMRVGSVHIRNAVIIESAPFRLLYVRPKYSAYRTVAERVFKPCAWQVDYDHVLGRKTAHALGYAYVLLARILPRTNRQHGRFERPYVPESATPDTCFADDRIRDKIINRPIHYWRKRSVDERYDAQHGEAPGLALNQLGKWAFALGVEDEDFRAPCLRHLDISV